MRSISLAALTAAAAVALSAAPAVAEPTPAPSTETVPIAAIDSLVRALRSDLGLTPEQFLAQATVGERLSRAASTWQQHYRDAFGGVWLSPDGTGMVGVADGHDEAELRRAAESAGFTVADVALTREELTARERQVNTIVSGLPADLRALVIAVRNDPTRNAVVVVTRGGTQAQIGTITALLKDLAVVDPTEAPDPAGDPTPFGSQGGATGDGAVSPEGLHAAGEPDPARPADGAAAPTGPLGSLGLLAGSGLIPDGPMRTAVDLLAGLSTGTGSVIDGMNQQVPDPGAPAPEGHNRVHLPVPTGPVPGGTAYEVAVDDGVLECSTGFNAELDGKPVVVTAAHCAGAEGKRVTFPDGQEFGTMTRVSREGVDTALIAVDAAQTERFSSNLVGTGPGTTTAITGTAAPVVGQKACKMGSRTGYSCGTITEVDTDIDVAGTRTIRDAFTVDLCALPGDSGGVVFSGDKALGISSASNVASAGTCDNASTMARTHGFAPRLSAVPIDDVIAAHPGLTLRTN